MSGEAPERHYFAPGRDKPICARDYAAGCGPGPHDEAADWCRSCKWHVDQEKRAARKLAILRAYPELDPKVAYVLGDAGIQPGHLSAMTDADFLRTMGIGPDMLRRIRLVVQLSRERQPCSACGGTGLEPD